MDSVRFDALARVLSVPDSRRQVLGLLTALPVVGGLLSLLTTEEIEAAGRRKRRKKAHKHGKGRRRKHHTKKKPTCTPTTCAAQGKNCGSIPDGCGSQIRCGADSCGAGFHCTEHVCRCPDGTALCPPGGASPTCCQSGEVCEHGDGACCTPQGKTAACAGRACGPATDSCTGEVYACGPAGGDCASRGFTCSAAGQCLCPAPRATCPTTGASPTCCLTGQVCQDGVGVCCTPRTCAGACGTIPDGCGGTLDCGSCVCPVSGVCGSSVVNCGSSGCTCHTTTEGDIPCFQSAYDPNWASCSSSATCAAGYRCWQPGSCLASGKCVRLCTSA